MIRFDVSDASHRKLLSCGPPMFGEFCWAKCRSVVRLGSERSDEQNANILSAEIRKVPELQTLTSPASRIIINQGRSDIACMISFLTLILVLSLTPSPLVSLVLRTICALSRYISGILIFTFIQSCFALWTSSRYGIPPLKTLNFASSAVAWRPTGFQRNTNYGWCILIVKEQDQIVSN